MTPRSASDPFWLAIPIVLVLVLVTVEPLQMPGTPDLDSGNDAVRWAFFLTAFALAMTVALLMPRTLHLIWTTPARWLALFSVWQLLVALLSSVKPTASATFAVGYLALSLLAAIVVRHAGWAQARNYLTAAVTVAVVASAFMAAVGNGGGPRFTGVMNHPNTMGAICGAALVLYLDRFLRGGNWAVPLFVLSGVLLIATDSRTSMIGGAIGVLVLLSDLLPKWTVRTALGALLLAGAVLTQTDVLGDQADSLARSGNATELTTLTGRTEIWALSYEAVSEQPVLGYGLGTTQDLFREIKPEDLFGTFDINHGHNVWVQLALVGGVPAVAFVAIGFVHYGLRSRANRVLDRDALVLAVPVFGISEPAMAAEPNVFFVIVALAFASLGVNGAARPRSDEPQVVPSDVHVANRG